MPTGLDVIRFVLRSFSICFPIEERSEIAKCRQLKRFQIFVAGFPSFGRGPQNAGDPERNSEFPRSDFWRLEI
jgi:hypothetical protein